MPIRSPREIALMLLGALIFVAGGIWLIVTASNATARLAGAAAVLFFGFGAGAFVWMLVWRDAYVARMEKLYGGVSPVRTTVSQIQFPWPVVTVRGAEAFATWRRLRGEGRGVPVVIGGDESAAMVLAAIRNDRRTPQEILDAAEKIRFPEDLLAAFREDPAEPLPEGDWPTVAKRPFDERALPWVGKSVSAEGSRRLDRVHIALVPAASSADVPALVKFGGFNGSPAPEMHVAALRRWHEQYGAELLSCTHDTIEVVVAHGAGDRREAMALARVFRAYSEWDVESYAEIAAEVMGDGPDAWLFWWD